MRNIAVVFLLLFLGIAIWKVSDRNESVQAARVLLTQGFESEIQTLTQIDKQPGFLAFDESNQQEGDKVDPEPALKAGNQTPTYEDITSKIKVQDKAEGKPRSTKQYERLIIPSLKVNANVTSKPYSELTWDLTNLGHDIAALEDIPGKTTDNNVILAGHITVRNGSHGPFRYLWKLNPGDKIILHDDQLTYTYIVRDQMLVYPENNSALEDTSKPQLTLITCHTWDEETLSYLRRLIVFADLEKIEIREILLD